jgi:hypothetical protein
MGMDVIGKNAKSEVGEYFRRSVWGWRPLWDYVYDIHEDLVGNVEGGYNDGDGLDAVGATKLANRLFEDLADGTVYRYVSERNEKLASLPRETCTLCEGTGVRRDAVGVDMFMPERELAPEVQVLTGRTHGYCNGCSGYGDKPHWDTNYDLREQDIRDFAHFLADSGGFEIW